MIITEMRVTPIAVPDPPLRNSTGVHQPYALRSVIQLFTNQGVVGLGESYGGRRFLDLLEGAKVSVVGHSPYCLHALQPKLGDPRVFAAVEVACLDLIGRATERPVSDLLGGRVRDRVDFSGYLFFKYGADAAGVVRDDWGEVMTPGAMVDEARRFVDTWGFRSLKLKGGVLPPDAEIETMRLLHEALPEVGLRIDPNSIWSVPTAIRISRAIEGQNLEYFEDPVETMTDSAAVRRATNCPVATNTCVKSFSDLAAAVGIRPVDVVLLDHHYWGGLRESLRAGIACRDFGFRVSMHSNTHLGISFAAMVHLAAALPQLDYRCDTHYPWLDRDIIQGGKWPIRAGAVGVPDSPGLGVELDRDALAEYAENYRRETGIRERDDVTEMQRRDPSWKPLKPRW